MAANRKINHICYRFFITACAVGCFLFFSASANAQQTTAGEHSLIPMSDVGDIIRRVLNKKADSTKAPKKQRHDHFTFYWI